MLLFSLWSTQRYGDTTINDFLTMHCGALKLVPQKPQSVAIEDHVHSVTEFQSTNELQITFWNLVRI